MRPLVVTCRTPGYKSDADSLVASAESLGYQAICVHLEDKGNWLANCNQKPKALLKVHKDFPSQDILFLDADTVLLRAIPDEDIDRDLSLCYFKGNLSTSCIFVRGSSQTAWALIEEWGRRTEKWPRSLDQNHFRNAWQTLRVRPDTRFLSEDYYLVPATERESRGDVILEHKQGRLAQSGINEAVRSPSLEQLRDQMPGIHMICAGVGPSARMLTGLHQEYYTIGVNDIGRYWHPDILVVVDTQKSFEMQGRWPYIESTQAGLVIYNEGCHIDVKRPMSPARITPPVSDHLPLDDIRTLPCYRTSVHSAVTLAYLMGAEQIGIIGCDFTPEHPSTPALAKIDAYFEDMRDRMAKQDVKLVNLSPISKLRSLPLVWLSEFETRRDWTLRLAARLQMMTPSEDELLAMGHGDRP